MGGLSDSKAHTGPSSYSPKSQRYFRSVPQGSKARCWPYQRQHHWRPKRCCRLSINSVAAQAVDAIKPAFDRATTEDDFLKVLKSALCHPKAPDFLLPAFHDFYINYKGKAISLD